MNEADQPEDWLEVTTFGSQYIVQIGSRSGRRRWKKYGSDRDWKDGDPPPLNRKQFEP